jgi:phosphoesterase RecJ-like protein
MALTRAWQMIQAATNITLLTHYKPDADGVSACAALDLILRKMGKNVQAVYPTKPETSLSRQPQDVLVASHTLTPDLLIACDTANYERLYYPEAFHRIPLINIDHHVSNSITGVINIINPAAASTCEELFYLLMIWCPELIDSAVAECLLFGILYDTQVFHTQSTTARSLRTAAACIDYGVNMFALSRELLSNKTPTMIKLWGDILQAATIDTEKQAAWAVVRQADLKRHGVTLDSIVGLNNFLAEIALIDVTVLFCEAEDGSAKISLRSKTRDVNQIAQRLGGGGHKHAAGLAMKMPVDEAVAKLTALL